MVCWGRDSESTHGRSHYCGWGPSGSIARPHSWQIRFRCPDPGEGFLFHATNRAPGVLRPALSALGFSLPETIVQEECHVFRAVMGKNVQEARFGHLRHYGGPQRVDSFLLQRAKELGAAVHTGEQALAIQPGGERHVNPDQKGCLQGTASGRCRRNSQYGSEFAAARTWCRCGLLVCRCASSFGRRKPLSRVLETRGVVSLGLWLGLPNGITCRWD